MSAVYLASDPRSLADKLADELDRQSREGDFFAPALVVVPNRYMRKWLRLSLARRMDVAINIKFQHLEDALWERLLEVDPRHGSPPAEAIDKNIYRLMVLSVLLQEQEPPLKPLQRYLQLDGQALTRLSCRRAWYLSDRLAQMLQNYEYDRQDGLIQPWLKNQEGLGKATEFQHMMERAQRSLFQHITNETNGKRALLNRSSGRSFKTFPQYAMELMALQPNSFAATSVKVRPRPTVHFFGFTHVSELHLKTIRWLGQFFDTRFYHLNVLASRLPNAPTAGSLREYAAGVRDAGDVGAEDRGGDLLRSWGGAGAEALFLTAELLADAEVRGETLAAGETRKAPSTVLDRLRSDLLGEPATPLRLNQDKSLQIVGCPGVAREVETVYNSILHNLASDSKLRQTDIAVLVTDMPKYRATLEAVFERPPSRIQFNMVDFNAAGLSMFGQAVLGMLDLALESFARSRVFSVLLNPCFLARLGVDRGQAMVWLEWAEQLGIYQGWDAAEKESQGYPNSPLYAWRLGLQRLRLGRYMEIGDEDAGAPAPRFGDVMPFADLASTEREHLDAFCKAVEGLLPSLARLRSPAMSGARWANALQRLVQEFLDVPDDRPEESQVRDDLLAAIEQLAFWDDHQEPSRNKPGLPLALVREYVQSQLEAMEGNRGEYLIGGVTISALQPMRPVPFEIIYVLGLGEDLFPGSNTLSSFDLRGSHKLHGDVRPAEERQYDFLATVLAARQKLYLLYNSQDLQKDQPLLPAAPLLQLQRHLNRHVIKNDFVPIAMPAQGDDERYLDPAAQPKYQDVLVQHREAERCLAVHGARQAGRLQLDKVQLAEWSRRCAEFQKDFSPLRGMEEPGTKAAPAKKGPVTVSLVELSRFLKFPAQASLRRHLRVEEEEEQTLEDEEPLVTPENACRALVRQTLRHLVISTAQVGAEKALSQWQERFTQTYADSRLRCRVPEEAFGEVDQASLRTVLQERIHGKGGIETFLREHANFTFCGPTLIGESLTLIGARLRFPALRFPSGQANPGSDQEVRLVGSVEFAWCSEKRFEILMVTNNKTIEGSRIELSMIEPALLHLALLANAETNGDGIASQAWLSKRECLVHVAYNGGIQTWAYPPGSITSVEASEYLLHLTRDFLDSTQFDLLPFDILSKESVLQQALSSTFTSNMAPDEFQKMLKEAIEDAREDTYNGSKIPLLVDMIDAQVPADALAKVKRRFPMLDRGPARCRQQPTTGRARKAPKK